MENVFDRLQLAELYQLKSLKSDCAGMISDNIFEEEKLKQMPGWIELEKNWPELALYVLKSAESNAEEEEDSSGEEGESSGSGSSRDS
jgi:hypothetical protein